MRRFYSITIVCLLSLLSFKIQAQESDTCKLIVDTLYMKEYLVQDDILINILDSALSMIRTEPLDEYGMPVFLFLQSKYWKEDSSYVTIELVSSSYFPIKESNDSYNDRAFINHKGWQILLNVKDAFLLNYFQFVEDKGHFHWYSLRGGDDVYPLICLGTRKVIQRVKFDWSLNKMLFRLDEYNFNNIQFSFD